MFLARISKKWETEVSNGVFSDLMFVNRSRLSALLVCLCQERLRESKENKTILGFPWEPSGESISTSRVTSPSDIERDYSPASYFESISNSHSKTRVFRRIMKFIGTIMDIEKKREEEEKRRKEAEATKE